VGRQNCAEMEELAWLGVALGARRVLFAYMQPVPREAGVLPSPDEARRLRERAGAIGPLFRTPVVPTIGLAHPDAILGCRSLELADLNVDVQGRLTLCCQLSGCAGAVGEDDVIADLGITSLVAALETALGRIGSLRAARVRERAAGKADPLDDFFCYWCLRTLRKLDWLRDQPDHPWAPASFRHP